MRILFACTFILLLLLFSTLFSQEPTYGTATVDGNYSEWNLAQDHFKAMYEAGNPSKDILSNVYFRYDCSDKVLYALVLRADSYEPETGAETSWIKFYSFGNSPRVDANANQDGNAPDFAYIYDGETVIGYEASCSLPSGTYANDFEVHININPGRTSSTGKAAQNYSTIELACAAGAKIGDKVWYDLDKDGLQDAGEYGISDITVSLYDDQNTLVSSTVTDIQGFYQFSGLDAGRYSVVFSDIPAQYEFTAKDIGSDESIDSDVFEFTGQTDLITLALGDDFQNIDAGLVTHLSSVGDFVWLDENENGIQDFGEGGVDGITVKLLDSGGSELQSTITSGGGQYNFAGLSPETYMLEIVPESYSLVAKSQGIDTDANSDFDPVSFRTSAFTLVQDENNTSMDAGLYSNAPTVTIGDKVWIDMDADGIQDDFEPGLAGVTVQLYDKNSLVDAQTTDENGLYKFSGLTPDSDIDYKLVFVFSDNYTLTTQDAGSDDNLDSDAGTKGQTIETDKFALTEGVHLNWDAGAFSMDWGDAKTQYPVKSVDDGASHTIVPGFYLGGGVSSEEDGQPKNAANGDDDDGVSFPKNLIAGRYNTIVVTASALGMLDAWIDWNQNNVWESSEKIVNSSFISAGQNYLSIAVPCDVSSNKSTYARFRFSSTGALQSTGHAINGEVEDYRVRILSDNDGDGVADSLDTSSAFDPSGYIYDEKDGTVIAGGSIQVSGPSGSVIDIVHDGSDGYYQFFVSGTPGVFTMTYNPPADYQLSTNCPASAGPFDPTGMSDPVVLGSAKDPVYNYLDDYSCSSNPYYLSFDLQAGDPFIIYNNVPLKTSASLDVELMSLSAIKTNKDILIEWMTMNENNNAGFNVYVSESESGEYVRLNQKVIPKAFSTDCSYQYAAQFEGDFMPNYAQLEAISITGYTEKFAPVLIASSSYVEQNIPASYALYQNFPNPFNPSTNIEFALPTQSDVRLEIYNIKGKLVKSLVNGKFQAGNHIISWDGTNNMGHRVSGGLYFYKIYADDFVAMKKMIYVR